MKRNPFSITTILMISLPVITPGFAQESAQYMMDLGMEAFFPERTQDPLSPGDALIIQARAAISRKEWKVASELLLQALKDDFDNVQVYLCFAEFHNKRREYPASEKALIKAIEIAPTNAMAHFEYSKILTIKGDLERAVEEAHMATANAEAGDWIIWAWEAKLHEQLGQIEEARASLQGAIKELKHEIKRISTIIYRYEGAGEVARLIEETDVVNNVGGGFTEVDVAYFETEPRDAPSEWQDHLDNLKGKLASLEEHFENLN